MPRRFRWWSVMLAMALLLTSVVPALAQEEPVDEPDGSEQTVQVYMPLVSSGGQEATTITYEDVMEQYAMEFTEEVPQGVEPIRVNSPEELEELMKSLTTASVSADEQEVGEEEVQAAGFTSPYCLAANTGIAKLKVYADLEVQSRSITKFYGTRSNLEGVTLGLALESPWGYFTQKSSNRASWRGGATIRTYILLDIGPTTIARIPYSCSGSYTP